MYKNILLTNLYIYLPRRYAGHSKWSNIKHIKAAKDSERANLFVKLCQRIKVAIQEGGSANPDHNLQLAQAIEVAKKKCMPVSSIQSCIKSTQKDKSNLVTHWYEVRGPGGSFIIIQALTDNLKKTKFSIAPILRKHRAGFVEKSCKHLFQPKGEIVAIPPAELQNVEEAVVDHAIECGAEEVFPDDNIDGAYKFICENNLLMILNSKLQVLKYDVKSADFNFIPTVRAQLSDEDLELTSKLMDKLYDHPEVVVLYDNIA